MSLVLCAMLSVLSSHPRALPLSPPVAAALPAELDRGPDPTPPPADDVIDLDDDALDAAAASHALGAGALAALAGACTVVWVTRRRGW